MGAFFAAGSLIAAVGRTVQGVGGGV